MTSRRRRRPSSRSGSRRSPVAEHRSAQARSHPRHAPPFRPHLIMGALAHTSEGMFLQDIGYTQDISDGVSRGWLQITDELRAPGSSQVRASVLATMSDVWTGALAGMACAPKLALTLDLTARILGDVGGDRLDIVGKLLKQGRTTIVAETDFRHPVTRAVVALSHACLLYTS